MYSSESSNNSSKSSSSRSSISSSKSLSSSISASTSSAGVPSSSYSLTSSSISSLAKIEECLLMDLLMVIFLASVSSSSKLLTTSHTSLKLGCENNFLAAKRVLRSDGPLLDSI